jgi:hypothetical protein
MRRATRVRTSRTVTGKKEPLEAKGEAVPSVWDFYEQRFAKQYPELYAHAKGKK